MPHAASSFRFLRLLDRLLPWCALIALLLLLAGSVLALIVSPPDYQQGESVRIMYVHVPAAWMGLLVYVLLAAASAVGLIRRSPAVDFAARSMAPIGAVFTFVCLVAGALWGKPMWGAWWVWDARLTSSLLLFFLYLGYIALQNAFDDAERGRKASSVLALVGAVNLPVIKFSVDWWNTLHQPASVFRADGPSIDHRMLIPLLTMILAFKAVFITLTLIGIKNEILADEIRTLSLAEEETP